LEVIVTEWSKRDRLDAAIAGEAPDRPPVAVWRHWPGDDQDAAALAAAHLNWQRDYDWDLVKVSPASSFCLADWGAEDRWEGSVEGTRLYTRRPVQRPDDWAELAVLDPRRGMLATQIEALRLVGEGLSAAGSGEAPFLATIFSPVAQAKNLSGNDLMLHHLRTEPDVFRRGLETITRTTLAYLEAARQTGIGGIFYAVQHARTTQLSSAEYQLFGRPFDEEILAAASDLPYNMVHIHGRQIMFDLVADYAVPLLNWHDRDGDVGLGEGLQQVTGAVCGGVSRWTLYRESPDDSLAEAQEALELTGGRRLVLGVGCVAMTNTPLRNLRALRAFVESRTP
jgi:uroporphyrinogen decarboxylase